MCTQTQIKSKYRHQQPRTCRPPGVVKRRNSRRSCASLCRRADLAARAVLRAASAASADGCITPMATSSSCTASVRTMLVTVPSSPCIIESLSTGRRSRKHRDQRQSICADLLRDRWARQNLTQSIYQAQVKVYFPRTQSNRHAEIQSAQGFLKHCRSVGAPPGCP